jgi:hypothetical protein
MRLHRRWRDEVQAQIKEQADGWMLRVDGHILDHFKAWDAEDAKREATRRLGVMVEWEPRDGLEYIAVLL